MEPYLIPRFNGRQLASQAKPSPTGLKNLKSLERAYLVTKSQSPPLSLPVSIACVGHQLTES